MIFNAVSIIGTCVSHVSKAIPQESNSQRVILGLSSAGRLEIKMGDSPTWFVNPAFCSWILTSFAPIGVPKNKHNASWLNSKIIKYNKIA